MFDNDADVTCYHGFKVFEMERWNGKVAVVTGASTGIGADIVKELVKNGLRVIGVARQEDKLKALGAQVSNGPGKFYTNKCDISKEEDVVELFQWIEKEFGSIHVLINNAGYRKYGKFVEQDPKIWKEVFDTNVIGLSICTQQAIKLMRKTGVDDGQIININSVVGHSIPVLPEPIFSVYPASKYSVTALTETIRQELNYLKTKIRVASISPGLVRTEFVVSGRVAMGKEKGLSTEEALQALPPTLEGKDIADAVVYVLSTPSHVQVHEIIIQPVGAN